VYSFDIGVYFKGGMAQLARACVLHTQGYRFDPDYLQLTYYQLLTKER
jgi:hypothetical protein